MEDAQKEYKEALNDMPGAWATIGLAITDSICSTVLPALSMATVAGVAGAAMSTAEFVTAAGAAAFAAKKYTESQGSKSGGQDDQQEEGYECLSTQDAILFGRAQELEKYLNSMDSYFTEEMKGYVLNDKLIEGIEKEEGCFSIKDVERKMTSLLESINGETKNGGDKKLISNLTKIVKKVNSLAADIKKESVLNKNNHEKVGALHAYLDKIKEELLKINVILTARSNVSQLHKKGPGMMQKAKNMVGLGDKKSLVDSHLQTAHVKLEVTKEQLRSVEEQSEKAMERQLDINRRLTENMMKLAKFQAEGATQAQILDVLSEGLKAFGQLKEQWMKLLSFFQAMTNLINTSLGPPLTAFSEHANEIHKEKDSGTTIK